MSLGPVTCFSVMIGRVVMSSGDWMDLLVPGTFGPRAMGWGLRRLNLMGLEAAVIPMFRELSVDGARSRYKLSSPV